MTPKAFTCIGVPDGGRGAGKDIKQQCIENGIKDDNLVELLIGVNTKQIAGPALTSYKNRSTCNYNVYGLQIFPERQNDDKQLPSIEDKEAIRLVQD